jgi:hypothetical protein
MATQKDTQKQSTAEAQNKRQQDQRAEQEQERKDAQRSQEEQQKADRESGVHKREQSVLAADEKPEVTGLAARPPHLMNASRQEEKGDTFSPAPTHQVITQADVRSDADALTGHFVTVIGGEHEGVYGVLDFISAVDKDGKPLEGIVVTRDENAMRIVVPYDQLRRSVAGRR